MCAIFFPLCRWCHHWIMYLVNNFFQRVLLFWLEDNASLTRDGAHHENCSSPSHTRSWKSDGKRCIFLHFYFSVSLRPTWCNTNWKNDITHSTPFAQLPVPFLALCRLSIAQCHPSHNAKKKKKNQTAACKTPVNFPSIPLPLFSLKRSPRPRPFRNCVSQRQKKKHKPNKLPVCVFFWAFLTSSASLSPFPHPNLQFKYFFYVPPPTLCRSVVLFIICAL